MENHVSEVIFSSITLISIWMVTHPETLRVGMFLGLVMQAVWILWWLHTGQEGIILLDLGILIIYSKRLWRIGHGVCND